MNDSDNNKQQKGSNENFIRKEGGWGWVVVIASAYCFGIIIGMINNYALVYDKLIEVYSETKHHILYAAWIGSIANGIQFLLAIVGSILVEFFNPRVVGVTGALISAISLFVSAFFDDLKVYFVTYSFLFGTGQAIMLSSTLAILPHYFKQRLSFANGLMNCFASFIVICLPILTSIILHRFSLTEAFYFFSLLNLIGGLACLTYKPIIPVSLKNNSYMQSIKQSFGLEVLKEYEYVIWCLASFIGMFGYLMPIMTMNHHSRTVFPDYDPLYLNIAFAAAGGISGIVFGTLGDITTFNPVHYHTFLYLVYGIVEASLPFANTFYILLIQITILGTMDGILLSFIVPICFNFVRSPKLSNQAIGYYHAVLGILTIFGTPVAGKLFEVYGNYTLAFYIGGGFCITGSVILIIFILLPETIKTVTQRYQLNQIQKILRVDALEFNNLQ